jgi:hypothetical protein
MLDKVHDLNTDTFKCALYTVALDATCTAYSVTNEVSESGTGYTAGGATTTGTHSTTGTTGYFDFSDVTWSTSTITAACALVYNVSASNKAVLIIDFGGNVVSSGGDFKVDFPAAGASTSVVAIAG